MDLWRVQASASMVDCFIFVEEACTIIICEKSVLLEGSAPGFSRFTVVYTNPNSHCTLYHIKHDVKHLPLCC